MEKLKVTPEAYQVLQQEILKLAIAVKDFPSDEFLQLLGQLTADVEATPPDSPERVVYGRIEHRMKVLNQIGFTLSAAGRAIATAMDNFKTFLESHPELKQSKPLVELVEREKFAVPANAGKIILTGE